MALDGWFCQAVLRVPYGGGCDRRAGQETAPAGHAGQSVRVVHEQLVRLPPHAQRSPVRWAIGTGAAGVGRVRR